MATLTLFDTNGRATYSVHEEVAYDAANNPVFYIVNNSTCHRCTDGQQLFWVSDNYLIRDGGVPAFYFDPFEREAELETMITQGRIDDPLKTTVDQVFGYGAPMTAEQIAALNMPNERATQFVDTIARLRTAAALPTEKDALGFGAVFVRAWRWLRRHLFGIR
jgi:hypothetical protein